MCTCGGRAAARARRHSAILSPFGVAGSAVRAWMTAPAHDPATGPANRMKYSFRLLDRALAAVPIAPIRAAKVLLPGPASGAERTQRGGCSCVAALSLGRAR